MAAPYEDVVGVFLGLQCLADCARGQVKLVVDQAMYDFLGRKFKELNHVAHVHPASPFRLEALPIADCPSCRELDPVTTILGIGIECAVSPK